MPDARRVELARRHLTVLMVAALAVHGALMVVVHWRTGGVDGFAFSSVDATEYHALARNLCEHGTFSTSTSAPLEIDYWRTPGYPIVLATMMGVVGKSPALLVLAQQVFSILNVGLVFVMARHHMSERRALLVGLLYLVAPYRLYYATWLLATTVFSTSILCLWWLWWRWRRSPTLPRSAMIGAICGVTVLVRPIALLLPVALFVHMVTVCRPPADHAMVRRRTSWLAGAVSAICCAAVLTPWIVRNRVQSGHWALSSQTGIVLAYFKATEVVLWQSERSGDRYEETSLHPDDLNKPHVVWDEIDRRLQEHFREQPTEVTQTLTWRHLAQGNRSKLDPFAVSQALTRIAWAMLWERPLQTAGFCAGRGLELLVFPLHLATTDRLPGSQRLRYVGLGGAYAALLVLAVANVIRNRGVWGFCFFPLAGTVCLILTTVPQLDPRFRVPMLPFLLVLALRSRSAPTEEPGMGGGTHEHAP